MQYLITIPGHEPFTTKWYQYENHYTEGMVVYDLINQEIVIDHL